MGTRAPGERADAEIAPALEYATNFLEPKPGRFTVDNEAVARAIRALVGRLDVVGKNYRFMVERAADQKLDGYRELGARAAAAENKADRLRGELTEAQRVTREAVDLLRAWDDEWYRHESPASPAAVPTHVIDHIDERGQQWTKADRYRALVARLKVAESKAAEERLGIREWVRRRRTHDGPGGTVNADDMIAALDAREQEPTPVDESDGLHDGPCELEGGFGESGLEIHCVLCAAERVRRARAGLSTTPGTGR